MQCPVGSTYSECIPTCPPKNCENVHTYKTLTNFCSEEACVEGNTIMENPSIIPAVVS